MEKDKLYLNPRNLGRTTRLINEVVNILMNTTEKNVVILTHTSEFFMEIKYRVTSILNDKVGNEISSELVKRLKLPHTESEVIRVNKLLFEVNAILDKSLDNEIVFDNSYFENKPGLKGLVRFM